MIRICESHIEEAALAWFEELGWATLHGPNIAPDEPSAERASYSDVILRGRLEAAIDSLNPTLPEQARDDTLTHFRQISPMFHPGRDISGFIAAHWKEYAGMAVGEDSKA